MKSVIIVAITLTLAASAPLSKQYSPFIVLSHSQETSNFSTGALYQQFLQKVTKSSDKPAFYFEVESDVNQPQTAIKQLFRNISVPEVFSSLADSQTIRKFKQEFVGDLASFDVSNISQVVGDKAHIKLSLSDLLKNNQILQNIVKLGGEAKPNFIFTFSHDHRRLLQQETVPVADNEDGSNILDAIEPSSLSCILVSLFLAISLLIAVNCMMNLKTNDKFGRNNLAVGKES